MSAERERRAGAGVYLDHAATSHPKPRAVVDAVVRAIEEGGNAGRGQHGRAGSAAQSIARIRRGLAEFFGGVDPARIALTGGATEALNAAIKGSVKPGDHVVTTSVEHNSVIRPLRGLERRGVISLTVVDAGVDGMVCPSVVREALRDSTRLLVLTHASNVLGSVQPVAEIAGECAARGVPVLLDAAQTAGEIPVDVGLLGVSMMAFPGHKGLLGPQGCGGLYVREGVELAPWKEGGTGSDSESEIQPRSMPELIEAGTLPLPALVGLGAGIASVMEVGLDRLRAHQVALTAQVGEGLRGIAGVRVYGDPDPARRIGVTSFNIDGIGAADVAMVLEATFGIQVRAGLHCAPLAHRAAGTFPAGTVRVSTGLSNSVGEVDALVAAVREIAGGG